MKKLIFALAAVAALSACQQKKLSDGIVLNEICGKDNDDLEWVEVANASKEAVNLSGYKLVKMDEDGLDKTLYKFPDTLLAPGAIMTVNAEQLKARIPNKKPAIIELLNSDGDVADAFDSQQDLDLEGHKKGQSYARIPNITGEWVLCNVATWDALNTTEATVSDADSSDEDLDFDEED